MYSHGIAAFLLVLVSQASAEIKLGCKSDPMPDANGKCPPGTTMITAGGCCPDNDVYSKFLRCFTLYLRRTSNGSHTLLMIENDF